MTDKDAAAEVDGIVDDCGEFLRGHSPEIQGAALADLLARWLAGHVVRGDPEATARLHGQLVGMHLEAVAKLIPGNFAAYIKPKLDKH